MNLLKKIQNSIRYGFKTLTTTFGNFPVAQFKWLGKSGDVVVIYPYGSIGNAPEGSLAVLFNILGDEANRAGIEFNAELIPGELKSGEYQIGNFVVGSTIKFDEDGNITIVSVNGVTVTANAVTVNASTVTLNAETTINGSLTVNGTITATGTISAPTASISGGITCATLSIGGNAYTAHVHSDVQSGGSNTGGVV